MITLFGHVLGRNNRLYLAYQEEWSVWAKQAWIPGHAGTFPTFEEWRAARQN